MRRVAIPCEDVVVGDILADCLGLDRTVVALEPYRHPTCPDLAGRIAEYVPGPGSGITLFDGDLVEVYR